MHHVYLIAEPSAPGDPAPIGPVKIGVASNVAARLATIQTGNPHPLALVGTAGAYKTRPLAFAREAELHALFAPFRMLGEWFAPAAPVVAFASTLAGGTAPARLGMWGDAVACPQCGGEPVECGTETHRTVRCVVCYRETPAAPSAIGAVSLWNAGEAAVEGTPMAYRSGRPVTVTQATNR